MKCFATGYPLPTISWRKGSIIVCNILFQEIVFCLFLSLFLFINDALCFQFQLNTNQGRFVLTSTGDLQIVQVHKSDSGTYVCVADNGIGQPLEREIKLDIAGKWENQNVYSKGKAKNQMCFPLDNTAFSFNLSKSYSFRT